MNKERYIYIYIYIGNVNETQIHYSQDLKLLITLYLQDTMQNEEPTSSAPLKQMVRRFVEQQMGNTNFDALEEDRQVKEQQHAKDIPEKS